MDALCCGVLCCVVVCCVVLCCGVVWCAVQIYVGSNMVVCVSDPAAAKRMLGKLNFRHSGIQLTAGKEDWDFLVDGLVGAK